VTGPPSSRTRAAVGVVFFANGVLFASWVSRIPGVKEAGGLTEAQLSLPLFAMSAGTFLTLPLTSRLVHHLGSRAVTVGAAAGCCLALPLPGLVRSLPLLALALLVLGAAIGAMDVGMNAQAAALERRVGRSIMASFHGLWSLGGLFGASLGGRLAAAEVPPAAHLAAVAALLVPAVIAAGRGLAADPPPAGPASSPFALPSRAVLAVGLIGACGAIVEGGIADWGGVYLRARGTGTGMAAAAYAAFCLAMTVGRFAGDRLIDAVGPIRLLRAGALLAAAALALALLAPAPPLAVAGFALAGLGMSATFPVAFSAAGNIPGTVPGTAIAAVATMAYGAGLTGPPVIGLLAGATSLPFALALLVVLAAAIAALAGSASTHPRHRR
jgi:fucose permease